MAESGQSAGGACLGVLAGVFTLGCASCLLLGVVFFGVCTTALDVSPEVAQRARESRERQIAERAKELAEDGKWRVRHALDPLTDFRNVYISLEAENDIRGWLRRHRPVLIIRCQNNRTDVILDAGTSMHVERGNYNKAHVRWRLDGGSPRRFNTRESTDSQSLFLPSPIARAKELLGTSTLRVEFIPLNADPAVAVFDTRKLDAHLGVLRNRCNW